MGFSLMLKAKTAWIFDLDGTLTKPVFDFELIRQRLGILPEDDILAAIERELPQRQKLMWAELDLLEREYAAQAQPADGVLECLEQLAQADCKLGILTRNTHELALLSLEAIGAASYFQKQHVLGREHSEPKPSPAGIHWLLRQWRAQPESAVMVGDYHTDLLSGRAAGVTTVHVDQSARSWPQVTDFRTDDLFGLMALYDV